MYYPHILCIGERTVIYLSCLINCTVCSLWQVLTQLKQIASLSLWLHVKHLYIHEEIIN